MDGRDLVSAGLRRVVESITSDSLGSLVGDELDGLDDTVDKLNGRSASPIVRRASRLSEAHLVLDTRVLSLGVLSDQDRVDIVVGRLVSLDRDTGSDVGEEGEGSTEGQVERDVTLSNYAGQRLAGEGHHDTAEYTLGVARGPLRATVLVLMLLMASSGMTVFPSFKMGVTSTSSHEIGTLAAL